MPLLRLRLLPAAADAAAPAADAEWSRDPLFPISAAPIKYEVPVRRGPFAFPLCFLLSPYRERRSSKAFMVRKCLRAVPQALETNNRWPPLGADANRSKE